MALPYKNILLGAVFSFLPWVASANSYVGLDGASVNVENELNDELSPSGARLRLGMQLSEFIDLETHLGGGTDRHSGAFDSFSATYAGAYLKAYLPVGRRTSVFGLAGLSGVRYTQRIDGRSFNASQTGFSYGFGLETQISKRLDLSADFMRYTNECSANRL